MRQRCGEVEGETGWGAAFIGETVPTYEINEKLIFGHGEKSV